MAINHKYTDKHTRKVRNISILYILLIAIAITLPILFRRENTTDNSTEKKNETEHGVVCTVEELEDNYIEKISQYAKDNKMRYTEGEGSECTVTVARNVKDINEYNRLTNKLYILVARYDSPINAITTEQLEDILITQKLQNSSAVWDNTTDSYLKTSYKNIGVGQRVLAKEEVHKLIQKSATTLAIIPFEEIKHTYKVVVVDGLDPLSKDFNTQRYPLIDKYWISGDKEHQSKLSKHIQTDIAETNYNNNNIRTVVLTGSSAIGSGVQQSLYNQKKSQYLSPTVQNIVKSSDITQLNNEASISNPCIQTQTTSKYCTLESNLDLIKELEIDVVGTNGNHIMDISYDSYVDTLEWYKKNNVTYYAGGENLQDSWSARVVEVRGLKFSFIGFNFLYPFSYYATNKTAGSANVDLTILKNTIEEAKKVSDKVFVDMNWGYEYEKIVTPYQEEYAQKVLEYGADVVFGTQSRIFQRIDLYDSEQVVIFGLGSFLPHTYTNSDSAIYKLTYYNNKLINFTIKPLTFTNNTVELAEGAQLDTMLNKVYSGIELK